MTALSARLQLKGVLELAGCLEQAAHRKVLRPSAFCFLRNLSFDFRKCSAVTVRPPAASSWTQSCC